MAQNEKAASIGGFQLCGHCLEPEVLDNPGPNPRPNPGCEVGGHFAGDRSDEDSLANQLERLLAFCLHLRAPRLQLLFEVDDFGGPRGFGSNFDI
jgi:hypothetical protein